MRRLGLDSAHRVLHQVGSHVVEHDNIRASLQGFLHLFQVFRLHFNRHRVRNMSTSAAHRLGDATGPFNMIILDHDGVVQPEAVIRTSSSTDRILLQHPVARRRLACIHQPGRQPAQRFHKRLRARCDTRQALQQVQG
ncbi:hypothetical protein D3C81_960000 [compost metagenome]